MKFDTMLAKFLFPVWSPADEGGGGGGDQTGDGDQQNEGGDGAGDDTSGDETVLGGGVDDTKEGSDGDNADGEDGADDDGKEGEAEGEVPEAYDFAELMPEGVEVDVPMVEVMTPAFKELGLTQGQANGLVKAFIEGQTKAAEAQADMISGMMKEWVNTAKSDPEIGRGQWDETVRAANSILKKFGTPELVKDVMVGQGVGNHPEVIRIFARIAKHMGDDALITGEQTDTSKDEPREKRWYASTPNQKKG